MKRYFDHMATKTPHERRQHATRIAGVCTAIVALFWLATLGYRLPQGGGENVTGSGTQTQVASVVTGLQPAGPATLEVSTTSVLQNQ